MIQIVGDPDSREYDAALTLREHIARLWTAAVDDPQHDIRIVAGAKCHGQDPRDIDLLLLATLGPGLTYNTFFPFTKRAGSLQTSGKVEVQSLCLAIEVKEHPPEGVRFVGTSAHVRYADRWKDASEQNFKQAFSVKGYLESHALVPPYIVSLLWLRNVPATYLPPRPHQMLGAEVTWELILNVVGQLRSPRKREGIWVVDHGELAPTTLSHATELFTKVVTPTRLDRQRVERINRHNVDLLPVLDAVGKQLVILRGQGGTGKTMRLLQLAHRLSKDQSARLLILTYNRALVADIRRLLTILGIPDDVAGGTIHIQTVHSYLFALLRALGLLGETQIDFLAAYEQLKEEALRFLNAGAVTAEDVERLSTEHPSTFGWDYVLVDEGQDWPRNERDLLVGLYGHDRIVVADGVEQLVRSSAATNWRGSLKRTEVHVIPLTTSLRMKAGLARFVSAVARSMGLGTEWEASPELPGGRVIVVDGSYFVDRGLHDRLLRENTEDRNSPVDMLFCMPAQGALATTTPSVGPTLERWGFVVWDGTREDVRETYPTDLDQLRLVYYESCRGLEGWTVVNFGLDRFYDVKLATALAEEPAGDAVRARAQAARWLMIPLTRAMDTLVIQLEQQHSPVRDALQAAAAEWPEQIEWLSLR